MRGSNLLDIAIVVPVYNRPNDVGELLDSIFSAGAMPAQVVLSDDCSPSRAEIRQVVAEYRERFLSSGSVLIYHENDKNLGYDGNLRSLFRLASAEWVMLMGNDDVVLSNWLEAVQSAIHSFPSLELFSRAFLRFVDDVNSPLGVSSMSQVDRKYCKELDPANTLFRAAAFVGGLVIHREWAVTHETAKYDGTLYYQIYLAALAFAGTGIGYISRPIIGGRTGNPPEFGAANAEKNVHIPGAYSAKGRAAMWRGVLKIVVDVQSDTGVPMLPAVRAELAGRQAFHVFEMNARYGRRASWQMFKELKRLGLVSNPIPWILVSLNVVLGRHALPIYKIIRERAQG